MSQVRPAVVDHVSKAPRFAATIVIPLLRQRDEWLERSIASALQQTVPSEVVVITSTRTPATNLAVLERMRAGAADRLFVELRSGTGFANAINTGIRTASSDRIAVLLSDDWLDATAIGDCLAVDADIVSTGVTRFTAGGTLLPQMRRPMRASEFAQRTSLEAQASYLTHLFVIRRAMALKVGGLDETIGDAPGIDDYDFIWTLLEQGATVGLTAEPRYNHRIHDGERLTMRDPEEQRRTLERIYDKHGFAGPAREQRTREHARWFGRPEDVIFAESRRRPWFGRV